MIYVFVTSSRHIVSQLCHIWSVSHQQHMNRGDYLRVRSPMVSPVATKPSLFFKIKINFRENRTSGYPICTATALSGLSNPTNLKIQITYINRYNPLEPVLPGFFPLVTNGWHSRYKSFSRCKFWNLGKVRLIDCLKDSKKPMGLERTSRV